MIVLISLIKHCSCVIDVFLNNRVIGAKITSSRYKIQSTLVGSKFLVIPNYKCSGKQLAMYLLQFLNKGK